MPEFTHVIPIFRILSEEKAREFYIDYLGFDIRFEHRFDANAPLYMGVQKGDFTLHLSEHYGDGIPGSSILVRVKGLRDYHVELTAKNYKYLRPGLDAAGWDPKVHVMNVIDPFGNRICFNEAFA